MHAGAAVCSAGELCGVRPVPGIAGSDGCDRLGISFVIVHSEDVYGCCDFLLILCRNDCAGLAPYFIIYRKTDSQKDRDDGDYDKKLD